MIEPTKLKFSDLSQALRDLESIYVEEIESLLISTLSQYQSVPLHGRSAEILEFAGRTNYKLRLRIPNKNVWSVSLKDCRESIRKVLRTGASRILTDGGHSALPKKEKLDHSMVLLLQVLPESEYENRSFVGNKVTHPMWGSGLIKSISGSGNVEVEFKDRVVTLKPGFVKLETV